MAIEWMDNFSLYDTDESFMLNGLYAQVGGGGSLSTDPDGLSGGYVWGVDNNGTNGQFTTLRRVLSGTKTTVGIGLRLWMNSLPSNGSAYPIPMIFADGSNNVLCSMRITTTGAITMDYPGGSTTTSGPVLVADAWQHIETWIDFSSTVGTIEVRVEGIPVIDLTGINTDGSNVGCAQVRVDARNLNTATHPTFYIKDYICYNGDGSYNNTFQGSVLIAGLIADGDTSLNWTPSTGSTGWEILSNIPPLRS